MKDNYSDKELFRSLNLDLLKVEKLSMGIVILKVNSPFLSNLDTELLIETVSSLISQGHYSYIVDFTETDQLDSNTVSSLLDKIIEVASIGGSVRLIVTKDKPRINFSVGNNISNLSIYLSKKKAIKDIKNLN